MSARSAHGFILPLTLWILAAITIVAGYLAERVHRSVQLAQAQQDRSEAMRQLSNARAQMLFRLATQSLGPCGLGQLPACVALDDRPYAFGQAVVQLQDARGLISLETADDEQLGRLLALYGLPPERRAVLIDTLRDYTDADDLRRLNGAEAPEYAAAHLPPPRNAPLLSPMELRAVYGWAEVDALWRGGPAAPGPGQPSASFGQARALIEPITSYLTASGLVALNPNTAPAAVLQTLPGITPELAQAIVTRRQLEPVSADLVDRLAGGGLLGLPPRLIAFPADSLRLTLRVAGQPWSDRYNVRLTPRGEEAPWRITSYERLRSSEFGHVDSSSLESTARAAAPIAPAPSAPFAPLPPWVAKAAPVSLGTSGAATPAPGGLGTAAPAQPALRP